MSLLNDLNIDNLEVLNEFDLNGFIDISNFNLGKDKESSHISFNSDKYIDILNRSISNLNSINLDKSIINYIDELPKLNIRANEINSSEVIVINTKHINNYIENVAKLLDKVYKGEYSKDDVDKLTSPAVLDAIKKNSVKTTFEPPSVLRIFKFHKDNEMKVVNVDISYIRRCLVPFINNYNDKKITLIDDMTNISKQLSDASKRLNNIISTMNKIKSVESTTTDTKEKLTYTMYYSLRNCLETMAYITAMAIQKIEIFIKNTAICNSISSQINNRPDTFNESYGAHVGVVPTDEESIGDALMSGDISAFKVLASNIYGLHVNSLKNPDVPKGVDEVDVSSNGEFLQGYVKYKKDTYENIIRDISEISHGVDFISSRLDEYLMVTNNLVNKAGFVMSILDKYTSDINAIEDLSGYNNAINLHPQGEIINGLYQTALAEVHDYSDNIQTIADTLHDCQGHIKSLRDIISREHNGEFTSSLPMIELKNWLDNFEVEFAKFAGIIGIKYLSRLRKLGEVINSIKLQEERPTEDTGDELDNDSELSVDFTESAYLAMYDMTVLEHSMATHIAQFKHYTEKANSLNKIITEADDNSTQQITTVTGTPNQANQSTTPKVVDPNSGSSFINKIIESINKWFNKIKEQFLNVNKKLTASAKGKAVLANLDKITSRDFTNVSVTMLPYDAIDIDKIVSAEFDKLGQRVSQLSPQDIQNIKSKEDLYSKIFGFIPGGIDKNSSPADQIRNYYKTGDKGNATTMKTFSGDDLKTVITTKMAPYITVYSGDLNGTVSNAIDKFNKTLDEKLKSLSTITPVNESAMFEAPNPNTTISMGSKGKWVASLCQIYTGAVFNALRDRYKDYVKALYPLIPNDEQTQQPVNQTPSEAPEVTSDQQPTV